MAGGCIIGFSSPGMMTVTEQPLSAPTPADKLFDQIARVGEQTLYDHELREKLASGRKLRVKFGIDLTAATLHIGHAVNLWLLRDFQDMGHQVVLVLGDFTTRVGDPDGRMDVRPQQSSEQIQRHADAILAQVRHIVRCDDPALFEVRYNSEWYDKMPLGAFTDMLRQVTHATLIARATFQKRIAARRDIFAHEMLYPVLQGYDSVMIDADITVAGADQRYNEMIGRQLQEAHGKPAQTIITTRISAGTDGELKQSKSLGNYVGLSQDAHTQFMRLTGIPEHLVELFLRLYTDVPLDTIALWAAEMRRNPALLRMRMAAAVVERYHGENAARRELAHFEWLEERRARVAALPAVVVFQPRVTLLELVMAARPDLGSKGSRAAIENGEVALNEERRLSPDSEVGINDDDVLLINQTEVARFVVLRANDFASKRLLMRPLQVEDIDRVLATLPQKDIVTYLGLPKGGEGEGMAREVMQRVIARPEPKDERMWTVALRDRPEQVIGMAHLSMQGGQGTENIWLNETYHSGGYAEEVLDAVNDYAFTTGGVSRMMFKSAFSFAAGAQEMETMRQRFARMEATPDAPETDAPSDETWGVSREGWSRLKRQTSDAAPVAATPPPSVDAPKLA